MDLPFSQFHNLKFSDDDLAVIRNMLKNITFSSADETSAVNLDAHTFNPEALAHLNPPLLQAGRSGWDDTFSDPRNHNPDAFRYLLHGIQDSWSRIAQYQAIIGLSGKFDPSQNIDLSQTPGFIRNKKVISTSVVDQDHLATFGEAGLILAAPYENIIDISHQDLGTNFADPDSVVAKKNRIHFSLDQILKQTGSGHSQWNEAQLSGSTQSGEVSVVGFWIKVDERGVPKNLEIAERMQYLAKLFSMPLVTFVIESKPFIDSPLATYEMPGPDGVNRIRAVGLNQSGLRYFIELNKGEAVVYNRYLERRPMTAEEVRMVEGRIHQELDTKVIEQILDRLDLVVKQCCKSNLAETDTLARDG